jgi:hypothetical protein
MRFDCENDLLRAFFSTTYRNAVRNAPCLEDLEGLLSWQLLQSRGGDREREGGGARGGHAAAAAAHHHPAPECDAHGSQVRRGCDSVHLAQQQKEEHQAEGVLCCVRGRDVKGSRSSVVEIIRLRHEAVSVEE